MSPKRSPLRRLGSRTTAIWLLAGVAACAILGAVVPQVSLAGSGAVAQWQARYPLLSPVARALGLFDVFNSLPFLLLVAWLALSTAACAWERGVAAFGAFARAGSVSEADVRRLRERPQRVVPVAAGREDEALDALARSLRRMRLSVRHGPKLLSARTGRFRLLGSPLFHATLALLFLVIGLGRLGRCEGVLQVPVGSTVTDSAESYARANESPLCLGHSGLGVGASDLVFEYTDRDGVPRGASPVVTLYARDGRQLAGHHVYPNAPLRHGSLLVHMAGYGLAPVFSLESTGGSVISTAHAFVDFDASKASGTTPAGLEVTGADDSVRHDLRVVVPADRTPEGVVGRVPRDGRVEVSVASDEGTGPPVTLRPGEALTLPEGARLRLVSIGYYARLDVADDWSVYPMYLLFALAAAAVSASLWMPYRTVRALLADGAGGPELRAAVSDRRGDPLFAERVEAALREAAGREPAEKEESA